MKTSSKTPLQIWIFSVVILIVCILSDSIFDSKLETILDKDTAEMIWLITVLPSIFFSYYKGLYGGLFIASISIIANLSAEILESFQNYYIFESDDLRIAITILFLHLLFVISIGILVDKLKYKELELIKLNEKLENLSLIDELTGLFNRRGFLKLSEQAILNNPKSICLFIDLDKFKFINDKYGHDIGDELLKIIAERLNNCVLEGDIVGRIGGDEFVCLLINSDVNKVKQIASNILISLSTSILISEHQLIVTPSIGIAISPCNGNNIEELLRKADLAMYKAKRKGKNNFQFYKEEPNLLN
ncbi:GGDEF domain-containing protein [Metabacillus fastidiosus]|uniref:GGDEF domain-containing protein n=1 Tax=Metabacillus fastidiosus TaxID=1458 RepID=UPI002DB9CE83|nr:GGDEF domain-containing protein [Metabacillus fastidiosus]MEC2076339.1 GGDEF domain-containing protein [Metabacillus fastidiosus]